MKVTVDELDDDERATLEAAEKWAQEAPAHLHPHHFAYVRALTIILHRRFPKPATSGDLALAVRRGLVSNHPTYEVAIASLDELVRRAEKKT